MFSSRCNNLLNKNCLFPLRVCKYSSVINITTRLQNISNALDLSVQFAKFLLIAKCCHQHGYLNLCLTRS